MRIQPFFIGLWLLAMVQLAAAASGAGQSSTRVRYLVLQTSINPVMAGFVVEQIETANRLGERAVLLQIDTPGGLDSAMRSIIQAELNSTLPVIVYVAPHGARAASAGALITLAADFAAMAPGTNIGAAHPVAIGPGGGGDETMMNKVVNDAVAYARSLAQQRGRNQQWAEQAVRKSISTPAVEALEQQVIDLLADDAQALLQALDGRKYLRDGQTRVFQGKDALLYPVVMNWRQQILNAISNPNVAYLLMMLGLLGIFFEISQPGVILPGVVGAIALLLAFFAFQTLPVNYVGVLLILLALVLFILEVKVVSYGMLTVGGIAAMAIGSLMLIDSSEPYLQISTAVIAATVTVSAGFFLLATWMVIRTQRRPAVSGHEGMVGERGRAVTEVAEQGRVFVHGEYWRARSAEPIAAEAEIEVVRVADGLLLEVRPYRRQEEQTTATDEEG